MSPYAIGVFPLEKNFPRLTAGLPVLRKKFRCIPLVPGSGTIPDGPILPTSSYAGRWL